MHYIPLRAVIDNAAPIKKNVTKANQELSSVIFDIMQSRVKDRLDGATRLAIRQSSFRGYGNMEKGYSDFCKQDP
ncbi:hypothetical protein PS15p_200729 [Mucor circinelloides]